jgi:hypothetical protein
MNQLWQQSAAALTIVLIVAVLAAFALIVLTQCIR